MARVQPPKQSFNAGEFSDRLIARTDFSKYPNAVAVSENMIPLPEGGLSRRPGTRYVAATKTSTVTAHLKGFQYSTTQAYIIELGDQVFRFFKDQAQIVVQNTDAVIVNGAFPAGISSWTDRSTGAGSIAHDATNFRLSLVPGGATAADLGWAEQAVTNTTAGEHVLRFRVIGAPGDQVRLRIGTSSTGTQLVNDFLAQVGWHSYSFTATAADFYVQFINDGLVANKTVQIDDVSLIDDGPLEITTPYTEALLPTVEGPQSADVLYLYQETIPTYRLERRGHARWALVEVAWQDGPWLNENATTTTIAPAAATGLGITFTASSIKGINTDTGFQSTDVGRLIRYTDATVDWGWGVIVSITSTTAVKVDIKRTMDATTAETKWRLGSWSGTTGYPAGGTFFEQRLFSFRTTTEPQNFWGSNSSDFENMAPDSDPTAGLFDGTVEDDDAIDWIVTAEDVNSIQWMSAGEATMQIGTLGGEWEPTSVGAILKPSDIAVHRSTKKGSAAIQPLRVGRSILFVQRAKRKIWELSFSFEANGLEAQDMTRLSYHVSRGGITDMAYQQEPGSVVWCVRTDGVMPTMTYRRDEDVVGWSRQIIGGSFGSGNAVVESVAVIPGANGAGQIQDSSSRDEVWMIVKRTINGATVRYVEVLEREFETGDTQADAYYSDSIVTYNSTSTSTITGLSHLEGETVKIWADGAVQPDKTVASGSITLDDAASVVQVGLGYYHTFQSLKHEGGSKSGTAVGRTQRITGLTFVVLNSHTIKFGPDVSNLLEIDFREVSDAVDAAAPLYTGDFFHEMEADWLTDSRIVIKSNAPSPFTILEIIPEIDLKEMR